MYIKFQTDAQDEYEVDLQYRTFSVNEGRWRQFQQAFAIEQGLHVRLVFLTYHQHHVTDPIFHIRQGYVEVEGLKWQPMIFQG